ncbi:hypothetical protein Tmath_1499 [Thermoanaerobacter mathranii subsp. mathranii str. A3]|uniref:Uncharacterized protein n=1 Tax=Thermoanaerobacter mathranii subsp. mathranii (strain DSM 11426 / CCUG 53645 / CIP 108742 / A3) TaxID=583358 RepID=A0ABM5LRE3_THEM3|nr:hypothetical protein Tmath_1499 [Thermoanaerobacter mathranii subsp. mathranii str. A3]
MYKLWLRLEVNSIKIAELFDDYELRARIAPALIVASPLIFPAMLLMQVVNFQLLESTVILILILLFIYLLSLLIRHQGKNRQEELWVRWGEVPSTRIMLKRDNILSEDIKQQVRDVVLQCFDIYIVPGSETEEEKINDAFFLVRQRVRQLNPDGLWYKHNAEYGFLRNLWGSFNVWIAIATLSTIFTMIIWIIQPSELGLIFLGFGVVTIIIIPLVHYKILPAPLKTAADRYAESTWLAFLNLEAL